jgi:glycosyltransferase involved in cell wall biosynthesis
VQRISLSSNYTNPGDKKVTVGVCVRNGAAVLQNAIDSILRQDFQHDKMELIFVDDGSTDNTYSIIQANIPRMCMQVKVFHHEWKGLGSSRDIVVDNASGEYIVWVDCDMTISSGFITKQVAYMDNNPTVGIAKGQYGICPQKNLAGYLENIEFVAAHQIRIKKPNSLHLGTGGSIYRVRAIKEAGGFNHSIKCSGEDADAENRVRKKGWCLAATTPIFYERRRENWRALWIEYFWLGKGAKKFNSDEMGSASVYRLWPPVVLLAVVSRILTSYRLTCSKVVFLMPIGYIFKRAAWFLGFAKTFSKD